MTELKIQASDGAELQYEGELVHEDRFEFELNDQISRAFVFDVYAIEGGGFLSSIDFKTSCSREESVKFCEEAENLEEIERFFYVFDVNEYVLEVGGLDREQKLERTNISKRLAKEYESHMYAFLEIVGKQIVERGLKDRFRDETAGSIWGIFKPK